MAINLFGRELGVFYLISQVFALVALLIDLYAFQRRKKVQLLNFNTVASINAVLHYVFLGAWSGAAIKAVATIRDAVAAYEAHNRKTSKILPLIFTAFYVIAGILAFDSPLAILPIAASIIYTIAIYIADITKIRYIAILTSGLWLVYNACILSIVGVVSEAIFIFDDLIAIYRYRKRGKERSHSEQTGKRIKKKR